MITFKEIIKPVEVKKEQEKKSIKGTVTDEKDHPVTRRFYCG